MRQVLLRIWLKSPWSWGTDADTGLPLVGAGWLVLALLVLTTAYHLARGNRQVLRDRSHWGFWVGVLVVLSMAGALGWLPASVPIFGYGMMVLLGFLSGMGFTLHRARQTGWNPDLVLDVSMWLLIGGVFGGRLAHLIQYHEAAYLRAKTPWDYLVATVNLSEGGLVLIGALAGGMVGFLAFCRVRKINTLDFADLLVPAVFIGIGFGRIGCLLNGCCFGDRCDLPWGIRFPAGSVTWLELVQRGMVSSEATMTYALHPTQIYSSLDGFLLAAVTGIFYWYRRRAGDVLALACILYPLTRIQIEYLRADESGQLGTGLTISQLYSLAILAGGFVLLAWIHRSGGRKERFTGN